MKIVNCDTNLILRYLLNDHPNHSKRAKEFFKTVESGKIKGRISTLTIAEIYWTLTSPLLKLDRKKVAETLIGLIQMKNIVVEKKKVLLQTLNLLKEKSIDFVDVFNAFDDMSRNEQIASFDKDLDKINNHLRFKIE